MKACVRANDAVCRLGGDEFTILLEDAGDDEAVRALCQRIVNFLSEAHVIGQECAFATPSIGVVTAIEHETPDKVSHRADLAMYEAKRAGKATYRIAA